MNALNVVCLLLVAGALAVAVGVVHARLVRRREAREDREDYTARAHHAATRNHRVKPPTRGNR